MDLLRGDVRALYRRYFLAAFGSALISCIYGVVDMAMVASIRGRTVRRRWRSWRRCGTSSTVSACSRASAAASCSAQSGGTGGGERVFHDGRVCLRAAAAEYLFHVLFSGHPQAGRCVFRLRRAGARHQRRADFAAAGRAWAGLDLVGHAGHGAAGRVLCRDGHAARDAGAAAVLKPGLSAYTPFIGGDVHEALESLFVRGGVPAADGGEDGRPGGSRRCA